MIETFESKPLGEIVSLQRGFDLPAQSRTAGEIAVIGSNGIVGYHNATPTDIPIPGLMLGRSGSVGEITYWGTKYWPLNTVLYVKDFHGNDPRFLSYWLQLFPFKQYAQGVSVPTLNRNSINDVLFPLPTLEDQQNISAAMSAIEESIRIHADGLAKSQELKRAAMQALFTRGLRNEAQKETDIGPIPESWVVATIGDVALNTQYGLSVRGQTSGAYPILRMNCQEDGAVHYRNLQFVDLDHATYERFRLKPADLLFNRTNSIDLVGRMAIVDDDRPAVFASYLVRLAVDDQRCLPRFLNYFMNWSTTQDEIKKLASRAVGQANINASKLRTVLFPLPPTLDEQRDVVAVLDAIDRKVNLHKRKRAMLDELFKSLLHKLMTGEIRVGDLDLSALNLPRLGEAVA